MYIKPLSDHLHERLIGRPPKPIASQDVRRIQQYIKRFFPDGVTDNSPVVNLPLPDGSPTQPELDQQILKAAWPYLRQVKAWLEVDRLPVPTNWECPIGWSKWNGHSWDSIEQPVRGCYFLDIETVPVEWYEFSQSTGKAEATLWVPVCCVAISPETVYVWKANPKHGQEDLDCLYPGVDGIAIGHNIGYDQSYSLREHLSHFDDWVKRPMAVDTYGLWQVTRGHCNQQRALVNNEDGWQPTWTEETTGAGLADIYQFYYSSELDKGVRDNIIDEGWEFVRNNYPTVLAYCYHDNVACWKVFRKLLAEWIEANTYKGEVQWLTLWSMMLLSQSWCPLDPHLAPDYFNNAEGCYQSIRRELSDQLLSYAQQILDHYLGDDPLLAYKWCTESDSEDETVIQVLQSDSGKKWCHVSWLGLDEPNERDQQLLKELDWTPAQSGKGKGLPKWYRELLKNPSISGRKAPIILGFTFSGELLYYDAKNGYHSQSGRVPNPKERGEPVHSMLMKDFKGDARLSAIEPIAESILQRVHSTLNWVSLRKRIASMHSYDVEGYPVFKDQLRPWGTVTRRSTSSVTQVLPKMDKTGCVGANVRALFMPPSGYKFVTADFDSQELLLAAELGDTIIDGSQRQGYRGSTPFSISCHIGDKAQRTTPHYLLADSANIDYTLAKNINYGIVYGLSINGTVDYFLMANKTMTKTEALERSTVTHAKQKGVKQGGLYYNGAASPTYNNFSRLVSSPNPRSLLSHQKMSKALSSAKGDYVTTKQNWFIQEAGSSMRDRLVVYTWYFMQRYGINGRLVMTIHDEAVFCVREDQANLMAYILQLSHLYIVAWKTLVLGLDIIPAGQAYFSGVDIDNRWRKSTKSNPPSTPDMPNTVWEPGVSLSPQDIVNLL